MDTAPSKSRLLLVDGDPKSLRVLDVSLKKAGFEVTAATSGREALALLEASQPDLIISDTDLDEMDGFALCRQIKARPEWNKIPFLFVSGRKSIEDKIRGLELGVDDYLSKPIYIKEIGIRVRTALQRAERERMESRREGRTRFAGDLSDVGVVDLVQTIELNRKSGIIHIVNRDNRRGSIFFRDGKIVDAEVGRLSGATALYRLFSWSEGQFAVEFKQIRRHDVVDTPMAPLLMEGMRRLDETTRLLEKLPSPKAVLEVDCRVLAEELAELPDEMNSVLRLCDGTRTLQEIVEDSDQADLEALTSISKLFTEQIVFAREAPDTAGESEPNERLARWLSEGGAEDGAVAEDPTGSSEFPAPMQLGDDADVVPAATPSPARTLKLPAIGDRPHLSGEETLGAALPSREEGVSDSDVPLSRGADTLKGVPVESLFAGLTDPTPAPAVAPPTRRTSTPPGSTTTPPADLARASRPPGLAERMLSDDSAVRASAMHEAIPDGGGAVQRPLAERNTREYGRPEEAAAALVDEVVSGTHRAKAEKTLAEPARPSKEVDWGAWASPDRPADASAAPSTSHPTDPPAAAAVTILPDQPVASQARVGIEVESHNAADAKDEGTAAPTDATSQTPAKQRPSADGDAPTEPAQTPPDPDPRPASEDLALSSETPPGSNRRLWLWAAGAFAAGLIGWLLFVPRTSHEPEPSPAESPQAPVVAVADEAPSPPRSPPSVPAEQTIGQPGLAAAPAPSGEANAEKSPKAASPATPQAAAPTDPQAAPVASELHQKCIEVDAAGKGKAKAVAAACRPALEADPKAADVMVILARAELDRGRLGEARALAKKALAADPQRLDAYIYLGNAEQEAGKPDDARAAYKKYLELAPNGPFARELRAILSNL
jgi:CheY-like chemotaxis protein